jgi:hypothetical protein
MTNSLSKEIICSPVSVGVVKLGLENKIREVYKHPAFEKKMDDIIDTIWTHYCSANPDLLTPEFRTEASAMIINKFGGLGVNEIREAFRLAASNVISCDLRAFNGRISIQVIGTCLNAYSEYRKPIAAEILRMKTEQEKKEEQERAELDKIEYQKKVTDWFESEYTPKDIYDCPFYFLDTLIELGIVAITTEQKHDFFRKAKALRLNEIEHSKKRTETIDEIQKANRLLSQTMEGDENGIVTNIAKRMALFYFKINKSN